MNEPFGIPQALCDTADGDAAAADLRSRGGLALRAAGPTPYSWYRTRVPPWAYSSN